MDFDDALEHLRAICLAMPEVNERPSHHTPTWFVHDKKVLAHLWDDHHGEHGTAIWCAAPDGVQAQLIEEDPERFFRPPYVGHRGWIGVHLDLAPAWDEVAAIIEEAYRVVAPKSLVKLLDASSDDKG